MSETAYAPAPGAVTHDAAADGTPAARTSSAPTPAARTLGGEVIVGDVGGPAHIHGVHGTTGVTRWKALASGADLRGGWEAVEWACVPPGGISGEHRHTRTEEIYFILSGTGEIYLDGTAHPIAPGTLLLTGLGTVHGLRNTGDCDLAWLVIEMRSPRFSEALGATAPASTATPTSTTEEPPVPTARLHDLRAERSVSPAASSPDRCAPSPWRRSTPPAPSSWRPTGASTWCSCSPAPAGSRTAATPRSSTRARP